MKEKKLLRNSHKYVYLLTFFLPICLSASLSFFNYLAGCLLISWSINQSINQSIRFFRNLFYHISTEMQCFLRPELNPLLPGVPFSYPKNTSENLRFFYDYNRYRIGAAVLGKNIINSDKRVNFPVVDCKKTGHSKRIRVLPHTYLVARLNRRSWGLRLREYEDK